jgi:hypothetical protein
MHDATNGNGHAVIIKTRRTAKSARDASPKRRGVRRGRK